MFFVILVAVKWLKTNKMLVNLFILLSLLGGISFFLPKDKYSRFFSAILFAVTAGYALQLVPAYQAGAAEPFVFHWIQYKSLHIDINLSANQRNFTGLLPLGIVLLFALFGNIFSRQETRRLRLGGLMCVNLAFLLLLLCANNLIVLMMSALLIGITTLYVINDYEAKKTYIFYDLISDMALFTAFAVIYSQFHQVELSVLTRYAREGEHIPLVAGLLLLSLLIKNGLFLFHNQLLSFRDLNFNRLIFLSFSSLPVVGILIYEKALPLLSAFEYSRLIIASAVVLSAVYALGGTLIYDDIKEKTLCFNMLFWAFLYALSLSTPQFSFSACFPLFLLMLSLNGLIHALSAAASDEIYMSRMGGFYKKLWLLLLFFIFWFAVFSAEVLSWKTLSPLVRFEQILFVFAMALALSHFLREAFFGVTQADEIVSARLKILPYVDCWLPAVLICGWYAFFRSEIPFSFLIMFAVFLLLLVLHPLRRLAHYYADEELQLSEFFKRFYELVLLTPITVLGRILWLTIDFVIIERTIINSLSDVIKFLIRISQKIHQSSLLNYILLALCGLGIIFLYVGR